MKASIIVIGNEILNGHITDTNSGWLAHQLDEQGIETVRIVTTGDSKEDIIDAVNSVFTPNGLIFITGGLGPTKDDVTKHTLNHIFGDGCLYTSEEVLENVRRVMAERGRPMNDLTAMQAQVPCKAGIIMNTVGTAPGLLFESDGTKIFCMPGVPFEMRHIFTNTILPMLAKSNGWQHHFFKVWGISESALAEKLDNFERELEGRLAYLPNAGVITLRLDCRTSKDLEHHAEQLRTLLGNYLLGEGDVTPSAILLEILRERGLTIATAESCTGGNIISRLTEIPGASNAVRGGVVAYTAEVKEQILGVEHTAVLTHGVVSSTVAVQMAKGVCHATHADVSIATTGIAGPGGAEPNKPVGTVWICWCINGRCTSRCFRFPGNRHRVIEMATTTAIASAIILLRETM